MSTINVNHFLDKSKFNRFHLQVMCWCFFVIMFDGFDLVVYGTVLPDLMKEWNMTAIQAGAIGSYALIGMMLGALLLGPVADRIGRKNIIILSTFWFSLFSVISSLADDPTEFGIYRFLTGLGLGGSLPNVVALMTEYAPKRSRNMIVAIMSTGYAVGGILVAGLSIYLLPVYGWDSLFLIGAIPLLTVPFMYKFMPESINYYVLRNQKEKIPPLLSKIDPQYNPHPNDSFKIEVPEKSGLPVISLFQNGRALSTFMIWIVIFMSLLMIYGLNTWLPKLMMSAGYPLGSSLLFLLVLNLGAIIGAIFGGWLADRWKTK
jgi:AAHS family benzoate transporter-like MFS transporter